MKFYKVHEKGLSLNEPNNFQRPFNFKLLLFFSFCLILTKVTKEHFFLKIHVNASKQTENDFLCYYPVRNNDLLKLLKKTIFSRTFSL